MDIERLNKLLNNQGYDNFQIIELSKAETQIDANGKPFTERNRLLYILNGRLKGILLHDSYNEFIINKIKNEIDLLQNSDDKVEIYYYVVIMNGKRIIGRCTEDVLLTQEPLDPIS